MGPLLVQKSQLPSELDIMLTSPIAGEIRNRFQVASVNRFATTFKDGKDLANAQLLAAAYTAFDKAGRELGIDATKLANNIDLAAMILSLIESTEVLAELAASLKNAEIMLSVSSTCLKRAQTASEVLRGVQIAAGKD